MLFYIRFRGQLRRTRPELITSLEDAVSEAASAAGGNTEAGRRVLTASFDEDRMGFWLDMVIFLERVHKALKKASGELYGFVLALGRDIPELYVEKLCRSLSGKNERGATGIWCSEEVRKALELYLVFDSPDGYFIRLPASGRTQRGFLARAGRSGKQNDSDDAEGTYNSDGYRELQEFRSFGGEGREYPYREKIERVLALGSDKNTVLLGPELIGKRDGIYHYCAGLLGDIPPLVVRFGTGGREMVCFADAFTPEIRTFIAGAVPTAVMEQLDSVHGLLFRERLREEWSPYMIDQGRSFIRSLFTGYLTAAKNKPSGAMLILENLCLADDATAGIFKEVYSSLDEHLLVLAVDNLSVDGSSEESLKGWSWLFSRVLKYTAEDFSVPEKIDAPRDANPRDANPKDAIPRDLWEVSYGIFLLGQYFPAYLFPQLFEEEGFGRETYLRALAMLAALGLLVSEDPRPGMPDFALRAREALGPRTEKIHRAVRKIILSWVGAGKLRPCFNLLRILYELGERAGDDLVLRTLRADVLNGTWQGFEDSLKQGSFASLVGAGNVPVLSYIYKTLKALAGGENEEIRQIFRESVPSLQLENNKPCFGAYQAQVQINLAAFYIGSRNTDAASEAVRKAMLLNRDLGKNAVPVHRFFSLVNLSRQRIDDALEYISFALEQAERLEQSEELVLSCYFASSINFLYGNLSKAERLALKAEETALSLGQSEWVMRAGVLRGRLKFEIGRYTEALEIFESLNDAIVSGAAKSVQPPSAMITTVRAWLYRTKVFLGRFPPSSEDAVSAGLDERMFEIEAAYFATDYERTKTLADSFLSSSDGEPENDFLFTEQPDWRSGFAQCEHMLLAGKAPRTRMAWIYRTMAQCALHPSREEKAEILGGMQRLMREELLPDTDPNDAFYFYAWYCMLRDTGAAQVDMDTVVSMAFKRLQRRAGRIDNIETKQAFLNLSRWNNTLNLAAREYKLI